MPIRVFFEIDEMDFAFKIISAKIQHSVGFADLARAAKNERFAVGPILPVKQLFRDKTIHRFQIYLITWVSLKLKGKYTNKNLILQGNYFSHLITTFDFAPGQTVRVAFAVWNGHAGDRDGKKSVTIWQDLVMAK
jgi:hypothetical protein